VDAIIAPASAHPPIKHDLDMYIGYTGYGNVTDWSCSVFPVTKVQPEVDVTEPAWDFRGKYDRLVHESCEWPLPVLDREGQRKC
jgi:amidase